MGWPLLFKTTQRSGSKEQISFEIGWLPIVISAIAATGSNGNIYLNLAARLHLPPCPGGCS